MNLSLCSGGLYWMTNQLGNTGVQLSPSGSFTL